MTTARKRTPLHQQTMPVIVEAIARIIAQYDLAGSPQYSDIGPETLTMQMIAERVLHSPENIAETASCHDARRTAAAVHRMLVARGMLR